MSSDLWRVSLFYSNNFCVPITFTNSSFPPRIISMPKKSPNVPLHVAIVPDGNRRWAKKHGLKPWEGHREGIGKNSQEVARAAFDAKIKYFTIWGGSYDNFTKRPKVEVKHMNTVYQQFIADLLQKGEVFEKKIRVSFLGEWLRVLDKKTIQSIKKIEEETKQFKSRYFTILSVYNGDREIVDAIRRIAKDNAANATPETLRSHLWTADLPPVDLVIRTGVEGDPHNSAGFMMWHTRDSQLYFSSKLWPDFTKNDLKLAIKDYQTRERRLGK